MEGISNRERYKAIARFERPGDLWLNDVFWVETLTIWIESGAPPELIRGKYRGKYFGFDHTRGTGEIASGRGLDRCVVGETVFYMPMPCAGDYRQQQGHGRRRAVLRRRREARKTEGRDGGTRLQRCRYPQALAHPWRLRQTSFGESRLFGQ